MVIRNNILKDLYLRLKNFITTNYVTAIFEEQNSKDGTAIIGVKYGNDQFNRLNICVDETKNCLFLIISLNINDEINDNNKVFSIFSLDDLNSYKSAISIIMEEKRTLGKQALKIENSEGYVVNNQNEILGIIDLNKITPEMVVNKKAKNIDFNQENRELIEEKGKDKRTILKFLRR